MKRSGELKQQGSVQPKRSLQRSVTKAGGMARRGGVGQKQLQLVSLQMKTLQTELAAVSMSAC